ncbi:DUF3761 domain-containing protein [Methylomonas albis]|nr:DUF3761 domain-containing protein [Methylomonas albis]
MNNKVVLLIGLLAVSIIQMPGAFAKGPAPSIGIQADVPNENELVEHGHYTNKSGKAVHSPAHSKSGAIPVGASAKCRDSSYSFSQHRRGTCSHHGGVSQWLH